MIGRVVFIILVLFAAVAAAKERPVAVADGAALVRVLPERVVSRIQARKAAYAEDAADLILSFGVGGGVGPDGIDTAIRATRAKVRAREMERFLRADLDNDGRMTAAEVEGLIARSYEGRRGKLKLAQERADRDGDGVISAAELKAHAEAAALAALDERDAAELMALMAFDLDRDGRVTLAEVMAGVEAVAALDLAVVRKAI
ncbi:EF-hand domain-containing protein [Defluviimonas sp. D31]|uniref:EF-hand domain-containing protein n=1 Tax=Defluviimonas sp. D31 TaxID=3083253 RepID=UPI00296E2797|nr:EF-hand domain-containing protein [Defluviimonas sp. D31]MDW4550458.1 EF-hand domain-containing protein [Defluviimonas sp. D31]